MRAPALTGFVIVAAIAAIFYSNKAKAMQDANAAGYISNPGDSTDSQSIESNTMQAADNTQPTTLSNAGLDALKLREGFSPKPYADHKGFSIGYGHLILPNESYTEIDQATALTILDSDVGWAEISVSNAVTQPITQNAFDALVSFCFNVGKSAFENSTLLKKINALDASAYAEFDKWVYARDANGNEQLNNSLIARRKSETEQFIT